LGGTDNIGISCAQLLSKRWGVALFVVCFVYFLE
jgi:hypothetical protein